VSGFSRFPQDDPNPSIAAFSPPRTGDPVGFATIACHDPVVEIPRPDLDALIWLTAREQWRADEPPASREQLHAVRGSEVYCGFEGPLDVQRLLWVDWSALTYIDGPEPCPECDKLAHRKDLTHLDAFGQVEMFEIYGARSSKQNRAILDHIKGLERDLPPRTIWEYRIDVGRAQFEDGIGDFYAIWRTTHPVELPPRPLDRKRLP